VDRVDGDLARLKVMATRYGGFFDAILDRYADVAIPAGLAYWSLTFEDRGPSELIGILGSVSV